MQIENNKLLNLIIKLRDMYLCRYDLQKLDLKYNSKHNKPLIIILTIMEWMMRY